MKLTMLGAAKQVSGSMALLETETLKIIIDCGLVQTNNTRKDIIENMKSFNFNPSEIDYCIITHAHIDHCGLVPYLIKSGYTGPVLCTEPTMNICAISLKDCAYIWQKEIERANRSKENKNDKMKISSMSTLYTIEEAEEAMTHFRGYSFDKDITLNDEVTLTFRKAGHILGAASLEFTVLEKNYRTKKVVFTGDISGKNDFHPFIQPLEYIKRADYLICESTYGSKKHIKTNVNKTFTDIIQKTCKEKNKTVLIASFSVQRLQELIWYLYEVYKNHPEFEDIPIYVDTPMGKNVSLNVYAKAIDFYDDTTKKLFENEVNLFEWNKLTFINSVKESQALANGKPKIIISSAGMMQAGRITNHMESFLPAKDCSIVLTGFCAIGTFGRKLLDNIDNGYNTITSIASGKRLTIRANVIKIDGLSGHADKQELVKYVTNIKGLKRIILNHGEPESLDILRSELQLKMDTEIIIPNKNMTINLK